VSLFRTRTFRNFDLAISIRFSVHSFCHTGYPFCIESTSARSNATSAHSTIIEMSQLFEALLRGARKAGRQEVEKELVDLRKYVKQLEDQLHKQGNWRITKVTRTRREDSTYFRQQRQQIPSRTITPGRRLNGMVTSLVPAPIPVPSPIHTTNHRDVNNLCYGRSNPWGSISRRRGRHFRSRTFQPDLRSPNTSYIRYTIPPLRPTFVTDLVSSSLSFPARLFSRFFDRDEGVAMRDGGTCGSDSEGRVPRAVAGVLVPFR
jgi:hypothetical protein